MNVLLAVFSYEGDSGFTGTICKALTTVPSGTVTQAMLQPLHVATDAINQLLADEVTDMRLEAVLPVAVPVSGILQDNLANPVDPLQVLVQELAELMDHMDAGDILDRIAPETIQERSNRGS